MAALAYPATSRVSQEFLISAPQASAMKVPKTAVNKTIRKIMTHHWRFP